MIDQDLFSVSLVAPQCSGGVFGLPMGLGSDGCVSGLCQLTRAKMSLPKSSCLKGIRMLSMIATVEMSCL